MEPSSRRVDLRWPPDGQSWAMLLLALVFTFGFGTIMRIYLASPMGSALSALKTRETRLEFMGVPARRVLLAAYVLSSIAVRRAQPTR